MVSITRLDDLDTTSHAVAFPDEEPRTVRLQLTADERIPPHRHPDRRIVFHVLSGSLDLDVGEEIHRVEAGDIALFDGDQDISPHAVTDSIALLVLAKRV